MQPKTDIIGNLMANKKRFYLIIGGIVVLLIAIFTLLANSGDKTPAKVAALSTRVSALGEFTRSQSAMITSGEMREQNATLTIVLTGAASDIKALKSIVGVKPDEEATAANRTRLANLKKKLESALVTNTYDKTYKESITAELLSLQQSVATLGVASGATTKATLTEIYKRLETSRKAFADVKIN